MADIFEFFHTDGRHGIGENIAEAIIQVLGRHIAWNRLYVANVRAREEPVAPEHNQPGNWNSWIEGDVFLGDEKIGKFTQI